MNKKIILCILDGFGISNEKFGNAILEAKYFLKLFENSKHSLLEASGKYVGLPDGQFGNSEVGHLTIGSGRIIKQKLPLISDSIKSHEFDNMEELRLFLDKYETFHVMGLFSDGGIHSHIDHFLYIVKFLREHKKNIKLHIFLDGRDTPRDSAIKFITNAIDSGYIKIDEICSIQGRYYAMDRDNRLERTNMAYDAIRYGIAKYTSNNPIDIINNFYNSGVYDETIPPIIMNNYDGIHDGDACFMINFRTDRIKQIENLIVRDMIPLLNMVNVDDNIDRHSHIIFHRKTIENTLGEVLSRNNLKQLRLAETEKYAHVTYFFNGGEDIIYDGEERILVDSPRVSNYEETPQMSSNIITEKLIENMISKKYDVIITNFANADMIGHTGNFEITKESIRILDNHIKNIVESARENMYDIIFIADHGNADHMINPDNSPNKSHSCSPVPFLYIDNNDKKNFDVRNGSLQDVAPTILKILDIEIPREMTGKSLISYDNEE